MANLLSKIKLLIQSQDGANQDAKLFPILPIPATVGDALTCSRALATATRVNSAGTIETVAANMPRITWELGVDQCPNLLVEKTRVNIIGDSEDFVDWTANNATVTANQIIAPDGALTADLVVASVGNAEHSVSKTSTSSQAAGTVFTVSCYAKPQGTNKYIQLVIGGLAFSPVNSFANFELIGEGSITAGNYTSATIELLSNGWYRCSFTATQVDAGSNVMLIAPILSATNGRNASFVGDGVNGVYTWGAEVKQGAVLTSYISTGTTNTAVTANADVISKTGIGTLLTGAKGLFVDCYLQAGSLSDSVVYSSLYLTDGTNDNFYQFYRVNNTIALFSRVSNFVVANITSTIITPFRNKRIKLFIHIEENNLKFYVNGALVGVDTSATIPTLNTIWVGKENSTYWDGLIKAVAVTDEFTEADIEQISSYPSFENMAEQMMYDFVG